MMLEDDLVSIVVPSYNAGRYLAETLQSIYAQKYQNWEAIIVDDGSTDNTSEIAVFFAKMDSRFRSFRKANGGVSAARNSGFNYCTGKYIAFLDADDVWLDDNISSKVRLLQHSNHGLVHSDAAVIDGASSLTDRILRGGEGDLLNYMLRWTGTAVPGPSSILMRREVIKKVGLFDLRLSTSADQDFFIRVAKDYSIGRVAQITWRYRLHAENMHRDISLMEHDVLLVYANASRNKLFKSVWFQRQCLANMYLILAANWAGESKRYEKGIKYTLAALFEHPASTGNILRRLSAKWKRA